MKMLGFKEKRRMVRNPYMNNQYYYPYQGYQQSQTAFGQNMYYNPYATTYKQPMYYSMNYQQSPYTGQGHASTPFQMPYPKQGPRPVQAQKGGFQSILSQFKNKEGGYDVNKMMNTAGQMMNTVNQLNGMVKQVGSFLKVKV